METQLISQSELATLNAKLALLGDNLSRHANDTMSKTHGINALVSDYFDSGGDKLSTAVLRLSIGSTIVYVPAIVCGQIPLPTLTDPGPARTDDGLVRQQTDASGAAISPGVPTSETAQVTDFATVVAQGTEVSNRLLLEHSKGVHGDDDPQVHGSLSQFVTNDATTVVDSVGHKIGRRVIRIKIGGSVYRVPCDVNKDGPPQATRIATHPQDQTSFAAPGAPMSNISSSCSVYGTGPFTFQWQFIAYGDDSNTFSNITNSGSSTALTGASQSVPFLFLSQTMQNVVGTISTDATGRIGTITTTQLGSPGEGSWVVTIIRCKITDALGNVAISHTALWYEVDQT